MTANARSARIATSQATNPEFNLTTTLAQGSLGECAAFICTLGDKTTGTVPKSFVEYLFGMDAHLSLDLVHLAQGKPPADLIYLCNRKRASSH
jgi:hypothetical protein